MASGHARLKKALVLRDALAHELGLDLAVVMRGLSTVEDTMTAELAMADGNYLAQLESLCRGDAALLTGADQVVRAACQTVKLAPRYAQYLSLILFAHWQKCRSTDEGAFLERLNAFLTEWAQNNRSETISPFTADDLQFAAFWMATGSGKTHVLHACIAMLHAAGTWDRTILITPSENLSRQHADKLRETKAFDVFAYPMDGDASSLGRLHPDTVIVVDINKLAETKKGDGVTIPTSVFRDGRNLVFVDEGHKGQRSEESVWKKLQSDLAGIGDSQSDHRGMLIEFSATFGQVAEAEATFGRYAKAIMLDYAYDRFHADLYGKDFWNVKLDGHQETTEEVQHTTLTAALIAYWYQLASFGKSGVQKQIKDRGLRVAKPLWVLLGLSVIGGKNAGDQEQTSECTGLAGVDHARGGFLHRSCGGGARASRHARDLQHGSGQPIHLGRLHQGAGRARDQNQHGWKGGLARQRLRRAPVADHQIRGGLPTGLRQRVRGPRRDRTISEFLQQPPPAFIA